MSIVTGIIIAPLAGALVIAGIPGRFKQAIRCTGVASSFIALLLSIIAISLFDPTANGVQLGTIRTWIPAFGVRYAVGIDGFSALMLLLSAILCFISAVLIYAVEERVKEYFVLMGIWACCLHGVLAAQDLFLWYLFWVGSFLPGFFLIGVAGNNDKDSAAHRYLMYHTASACAVLLGIIGLYVYANPHAFLISELSAQSSQFQGTTALILFLIIFIGIAIRAAIVPLHGWIPSISSAAPTPVMVIMLGLMLPTGVAAMIRILYPILPGVTRSLMLMLAILGLVNVLYGALAAMGQKKIMGMASYTGLVHAGYALLGFASITVIGWNGAALLLFAYGIAITAVLILFDIIIQRSGVSLVDSFGGLGARMPVYTALLTLALLACAGVPGFAVFMGMFLSFSGIFQVNPLFSGIALAGVILTVIYLIRFLSRSVWGPLPYQWKELADINLREALLVVPCLIVIIVFGFYPQPLLTIINHAFIQLIGIAP